jgi:hypothetical protein
LRLLKVRLPPTLHTIKQEVFFMKTSNLVALMIALVITTGGFAAINFLFTEAAAADAHPPVELTAPA